MISDAELEEFVVRIQSVVNNEIYPGMGFLYDSNTIITCAHVVSSCYGKDKNNKEIPGNDHIYVSFPIKDINQLFPCILKENGWHPDIDIAVLELITPVETSINLFYEELISMSDKEIYIGGQENGVIDWYKGNASPPVEGGRHRVDIKRDEGLHEGLSGSPVLIRHQMTMAGMLIEVDEENEAIGIILPLSKIQKAISTDREDRLALTELLSCTVNRDSQYELLQGLVAAGKSGCVVISALRDDRPKYLAMRQCIFKDCENDCIGEQKDYEPVYGELDRPEYQPTTEGIKNLFSKSLLSHRSGHSDKPAIFVTLTTKESRLAAFVKAINAFLLKEAASQPPLIVLIVYLRSNRDSSLLSSRGLSLLTYLKIKRSGAVVLEPPELLKQNDLMSWALSLPAKVRDKFNEKLSEELPSLLAEGESVNYAGLLEEKKFETELRKFLETK